MPETIRNSHDISSNPKENEVYVQADPERTEKDHLIIKKALSDAKIVEAKDSIRSELNDFSMKIKWMTPKQISDSIDNELQSSIELMESSLKNISEEMKNSIIGTAIKASEYLKSRAMDWTLDKKEVDEIIQLHLNDSMNAIEGMI